MDFGHHNRLRMFFEVFACPFFWCISKYQLVNSLNWISPLWSAWKTIFAFSFISYFLLIMTPHIIKHDINTIERKIRKSTIIRDQVFSEAYDRVVKLSCTLLPRDCQIEIINMLSPTPLSSPFIQKQSKARIQEKGFIVKLLPEAKEVKTWPKKYHPLIEKELYELRRSFYITFNYSNLDWSNIDLDCLFYLSVLWDLKKIMKSSFVHQLSIPKRLLKNTIKKLSI